MDFAVSADQWLKSKENDKKNKYIDFTREVKKTVVHESDDYTNYKLCSRYSHQRIDLRTGWVGNNRMSGDHPNNNIILIGQNTEKSHGDLRRLIVFQTPANAGVKNSQGVTIVIIQWL